MSFLTYFDSIMKAYKDPESVKSSWQTSLNTKENGWVVDTVKAFDTGIWETGIDPKSTGNWVIVEQYDSDVHAKEGHEKWVKLMRENPNRTLPDLQRDGDFKFEDEEES